MSYPTNDITYANLDNATDSVGLARAELHNALIRLSELINSRDTTDGLAPLDANGQVPSANMPTTFTSGGANNIVFQPATGVALLQYALGLEAKTTAELEALNHPAGTIAYCSDGDSGGPCLALSDGTYDAGAGIYQWNKIRPSVLLNTSTTSDGNTFATITVAGQSNIVADSTDDTLTIVAGANITLTTDPATDTLTIASAGGGGVGVLSTFTLSDGANTQVISDGNILTVNGTANEIEAVVSATDTLTIGLPNNVTVTNTLTASGLTINASSTIDAGSNKITNVGDPVSGQDVATKSYVDTVSSNAFTVTDGSTSQTLAMGDTLTLAGTANEINVAVSATDTMTIGLPNNVTITDTLSCSGLNVSASSTIDFNDNNLADVYLLSLNPKTKAELNSLTPTEGDVAYCLNGDSGSKCFTIYDGSNWKVISLGATIS